MTHLCFSTRFFLLFCLFSLCLSSEAKGQNRDRDIANSGTSRESDLDERDDRRSWRDLTGRYTIDAQFVTADDDMVVLAASDGELTVLRRDELSREDQTWIDQRMTATKNPESQSQRDLTANTESASKGEESQPNHAAASARKPTAKWKLRGGEVVTGHSIGFGTQTFVLQRKNNEVLLDQQPMNKLPRAFSQTVPEIVGKADQVDVADLSALEEHLADRGGGPLSYDASGIQIVLESGESLTIPISLLDKSDAAHVSPGFARWKAAQSDDVPSAERTKNSNLERLLLDSYQRRPNARIAQQRKVRLIQLKLLAADSGATDLWEVTLHSGKPYTFPYTVVVAGENSAIAQRRALLKYPAWKVINARKLSH